MEKENKQTSTFERQLATVPSVSAIEREEKETLNGEPTQSAHPAMDENIPDTTNITPGSVHPSAATSETKIIKAAPADDYLTGLKLAAVLAAVTMAAFLMLLDLSVVVTVSYVQLQNSFDPRAVVLMPTDGLMDGFAGYPEDHYAFSLNGRYWMVWVGVSLSQVSILVFEALHAIEESIY
jgi:hypothetical protein